MSHSATIDTLREFPFSSSSDPLSGREAELYPYVLRVVRRVRVSEDDSRRLGHSDLHCSTSKLARRVTRALVQRREGIKHGGPPQMDRPTRLLCDMLTQTVGSRPRSQS